MSVCELCPRLCRVDRAHGARGFCGATSQVRVFRWGPHKGEEPPICGAHGSGAIFFSRCTLKCLYCQNAPWSWQGAGRDLSIAELRALFRSLACDHHCENWNLVSPTPYLEQIEEATRPLLKEGIQLPFVFNSSGYERVDTLKRFHSLCSIGLIDLRYASDQTAQRMSGASNYVRAARETISYLWNARGPLDSEEPGKATRGLIVRLLVLPGHADEAIENLAWLATTCSTDLAVSLMSQYVPAFEAHHIPPFDRTLTREEYEEVTEAAADFGFTKGWIQGFESHDPSSDFVGENMTEGEGPIGFTTRETREPSEQIIS